MAWKRFPVPEFDYMPLKGMAYVPPAVISADEASKVIEAAAGGDAAAAGGYGVEPDEALLERLSFRGDIRTMVLCALPAAGAHLLGRSYAWFNQRAFILSGNGPDAEVLHEWKTPRPMNTRFGPEEGVTLEASHVYLLSGRIVSDYTRGNRVMVDKDWSPGDGRAGFRIVAACNEGEDNFHDTCLQFTWQA